MLDQAINILIADDEPDILDIMSEMLSELGLKTQTAKSGNEAYELISKSPGYFDVVLSDYKMPNGSGIDLLQSVRRLSSEEQPFFIMMTGWPGIDFGDPENTYSKQLDGFFSKPFEQESLKILIHDLLRKK